MPYQKNSDLPDSVKNHLPEHVQAIFREAFNRVLSEYDSDEPRAFRVAWSAVEHIYEKGENGLWRAKEK